MQNILIQHVLCSAVILSLVSSQSSDDAKSLLNKLFSDHNVDVRPQLDQTETTFVYLSFSVIAINSLDEVSQTFSITAFLEFSWFDEIVTWSRITYNGVSMITVPQNKIWKPYFVVENGLQEDFNEFGSESSRVLIECDGYVIWKPFEIFETKCDINVKYFPFDQQTCNIIISNWNAPVKEIALELTEEVTSFVNDDTLGEWTLIEAKAKLDEIYANTAKISFMMKRNSNHYVISIVVPIILMNFLKLYTFLIPVDSGEKIGFSVTVFLAYAVILTVIGAELPKVSGSLLAGYLLFEISMSGLVVLFACFLVRLHSCEKDMEANSEKS